MAQKGSEQDLESRSCLICEGPLRDSASCPCGQSYCRRCIENQRDKKQEKRIYSCIQCEQTFRLRPELGENTMLAALGEAEDVVCDVCTGRKLKACKSCLQCLASYCEKHLQPHFEAAPLKRHKLVEPSKKLQENVCPLHDEVMKMFCCNDQRSICYLCSMGEHKGHDMVSTEAQRTERQRELVVSRQNIQERIEHRERDVERLQQEVEAISRSADEAVENSEKIFTGLMSFIEKRLLNVTEQVRSQQETEVQRVRELQEKLAEEIAALKRRDAELETLSNTEDHNQFLHDYPSLSRLDEAAGPYRLNIRPLRYFEDVTTAVREIRDRLEDVLREKWTNIAEKVTEVDVLLSRPEPTRAEFLQNACDVTLDPDTVNTYVSLSDRNRKATLMSKEQPYPGCLDRFTYWYQVLGKEGLSGRCYWEVEWRGEGVYIAVAYKTIGRAGSSNDSGFGLNDQSWALYCGKSSYNFWFNKVKTPVSGPRSCRIGVYLDHSAGILSFYSISDSIALIHRVRTRFTEPLHAGLRFYFVKDTAQICNLKDAKAIEGFISYC